MNCLIDNQIKCKKINFLYLNKNNYLIDFYRNWINVDSIIYFGKFLLQEDSYFYFVYDNPNSDEWWKLLDDTQDEIVYKIYNENDIVLVDGDGYYKCLKAHTASVENAPSIDDSTWKFLGKYPFDASPSSSSIPELPAEYDTLMLYTAQFIVPDEVSLTIQSIYPEWSADSVAYKLNEKVRYNDLLYKCLNAHTSQASWTPTDAPSLWVRIDNPAEEWPEWRQPTGSTDAYAKGAKVSHNSKHWVSNTENNVWEPGVYGWDEQTA